MDTELRERKIRYAFYAGSIVAFWAYLAFFAGLAALIFDGPIYWKMYYVLGVFIPLAVVILLASLIAEVHDYHRRRKLLFLLLMTLVAIPIAHNIFLIVDTFFLDPLSKCC